MSEDNKKEIEELKKQMAQFIEFNQNKKTFQGALLEIIHSKKALAAIAGLIVMVANKLLGWELAQDTIIDYLSIIGFYIVGQGIADHGKEKAKIEMSKHNNAS